MSRAALVRAALRSWPRNVRAERGDEIADTLLEVTAAAGAFAREVAVVAARADGCGPRPHARATRPPRSPGAILAALIAVSLVAGAALRRDVRPAIACALVWVTEGLGLALFGHHDAGLAIFVLVASPTVLLIVVSTLRSRPVAA